MGSPETGPGVVDCSVGSIVWVRRRNGSWWPGKILGPEELSASHVMSPRSGTPVKLLGREDASVDWYNLEKSKRVKAFRCGEFDDCIERAEASQGMPPKKREKYARREDAILHALELERQTLEKKYGNEVHSSNIKSNKLAYDVKSDFASSSENLEIGNGKQLHPKTHQGRKSLLLALEGKKEEQDFYSAKEENQLSADDDNSGVLPRMRGLQDFGLRTALSNLNTSSSSTSNGSQKPILDSSANIILDSCLSTDGPVNGSPENSSEKRKRSHDSFGDESLAKRRDRRRPLVQVLQNSSKVPVSHSQPDGSANFTSVSEEEEPSGVTFPAKRSRNCYLASESRDGSNDPKSHSTQGETLAVKFEESISAQPTESYEEHTIESAEDTETDSSETDSLDSDDLTSLSEGAVCIELHPKYPRRSEAHQEYGSVSSKEPDDWALGDDASHPSHNDPASTSMGVSRWQLKGKRNNRNLLKRLPDRTSRNFVQGSTEETTATELGTSGHNETHSIDKNLGPRMSLCGYRGPDGISYKNMQWEDWDWDHQPSIKGYLDDSGEYFDPVVVSHPRIGGRIMLVDVDLKVQSSYQREHVPIISLMSKINGQAIVGHPIQIEALENGSSESLLVEADDWCPEILETDAALPPVWRTARRTANVRVPRPDLSSCDENAKHLQLVDGRNGSSGVSSAGTIGHKTGTMGKRIGPFPVDRKFSRKPLKKISLSSNQKIRTLSSIASQQKQNSDVKHSGNNYNVDGLIKPESLPAAVACIPVKLVFSRLQEELVGRRP